jgi:tRNA-specific 2-thiouridylase
MKERIQGVLAHALSGGVDSSVAASLHAEEWDRPDLGRRMVCVNHYMWPGCKGCSPEVIERAESVSRNLELPFFLIDMKEVFRSYVIEDFVCTYSEGKTPNPCVRCNEQMRFSRFYTEIKKLLTEKNILKTDETLYFSTGHYVRREQRSDGIFLKRARDKTKDQSYMLYRLNKDMLPYVRFPLGEYRKREVVEMAVKLDYSSASIKESQDICFIEDNYTDFICSYSADPRLNRSGNIVTAAGKTIGKHKGFIHYTIGQRKGLNLSDGPWYVTGVDAATNTVYVGRKEEGLSSEFTAGDCNWFIPAPADSFHCMIKVRYNTPALPGRVQVLGAGTVRVILDKPAVITPGQSAVFYHDDLVYGGGIIS